MFKLEDQIYKRFMKDSVQTILNCKEELYWLEMQILSMEYDGHDGKMFNKYVNKLRYLVEKINYLLSIRQSININSLFNSNFKVYRLVKEYCFEDAFDLKNFLINRMQSKGFVYKSDVMDDISEYYSNNRENSISFNKTRIKINKLESCEGHSK